MDKKDTIRAFAHFSGRTIEDSTRIINDLIDFITRCIEEHRTIGIAGFMTMGVQMRKGGKILPFEKNGVQVVSKDKLVPYVRFSDNVKNLIKDDVIPPELLNVKGQKKAHIDKRK